MAGAKSKILLFRFEIFEFMKSFFQLWTCLALSLLFGPRIIINKPRDYKFTCLQSISPGVVETEMARSVLTPDSGIPSLKAEDIAAAIIYAIGTPEHVEVSK